MIEASDKRRPSPTVGAYGQTDSHKGEHRGCGGAAFEIVDDDEDKRDTKFVGQEEEQEDDREGQNTDLGTTDVGG
jgi:hypothetical protein